MTLRKENHQEDTDGISGCKEDQAGPLLVDMIKETVLPFLLLSTGNRTLNMKQTRENVGKPRGEGGLARVLRIRRRTQQ